MVRVHTYIGSCDFHLYLFFFHIKVTGVKCLQEDATISQVSGGYILQCNIGEAWGRWREVLLRVGVQFRHGTCLPSPRLSLQGTKLS